MKNKRKGILKEELEKLNATQLSVRSSQGLDTIAVRREVCANCEIELGISGVTKRVFKKGKIKTSLCQACYEKAIKVSDAIISMVGK